jgi:hypothetical protein
VNRGPKLALVGVLIVALCLIGRESHLLSGIGYALVVSALVASVFIYPRPTRENVGRNFRTLLDIRRPEETGQRVFELAAWLVFFFGSLLGFLFLGPKYVLLDGGLYVRLLYAIPLFLLASLLVPKFKELSRYPLWANIAGRLGFCIPAVALFATVVLVVNCSLDRSANTRVVTCIEKRASRGSNPGYYVRVRPWNNSVREVELDVPEAVYFGASVGTPLQLTTGKGTLGLEWIRRIETYEPASQLISVTGPMPD